QGGTYDHADGISIWDTWYPNLIHTVYDPWLGTNLGGFSKTFDNPPNDAHHGGFSGFNVGSSFDGGWMDALDKDLRQVLGRPVLGPHSHTYCGGSAPQAPGAVTEFSVAGCRDRLLAALDTAVVKHQTDYRALTADDRIDYRSLGLQTLSTSPWSNRPTQQQAVEFFSHRDRGTGAALATPTPGVPPTLPNTAGGPASGFLALTALLVLLPLALRGHRPQD
ncbi:MAG: hypothetical protein ACYDGR_10235, partial [Candidatus Dormibacteria bacterium]